MARSPSSNVGVALVFVALAALGQVADTPARSLAVEPTPAGYQWYSDATTVRGKPGTFVYVCAAGGRLDQVWGTTTYADNSTVCSAAVQSGLITEADGGIVTIKPLPGQSSYAGSTANGVTSSSLGAWPGSFEIVAAGTHSGSPALRYGGGSWTASAGSYRGQNGSKYLYVCPGGGLIGTVYGTNTYTDDSSVCTAAVQVGLITAKDGGRVTIVIKPGQSSYTSFTANGVTTRSYPAAPGSFSFAGAAAIPGTPGGGPSTTTTTGSSGPIPPPAATATGTVLVDGKPFTAGTIPFGATVDLTHGAISVKATTGTVKLAPAGGVTAAFVLARGTADKRPVLVFKLAKGDFSACPTRKQSSAGASPAGKIVRQLWGNGKGSFQTRGRYAAATVRGTHWLTADRCDGTLTKVVSGVVQVTDLPKHKTVSVAAGRSYLAKP